MSAVMKQKNVLYACMLSVCVFEYVSVVDEWKEERLGSVGSRNEERL